MIARAASNEMPANMLFLRTLRARARAASCRCNHAQPRPTFDGGDFFFHAIRSCSLARRTVERERDGRNRKGRAALLFQKPISVSGRATAARNRRHGRRRRVSEMSLGSGTRVDKTRMTNDVRSASRRRRRRRRRRLRRGDCARRRGTKLKRISWPRRATIIGVAADIPGRYISRLLIKGEPREEVEKGGRPGIVRYSRQVCANNGGRFYIGSAVSRDRPWRAAATSVVRLSVFKTRQLLTQRSRSRGRYMHTLFTN